MKCSQQITAWKVFVFGVFLFRMQSKGGKIRTRKSPNTDRFHEVNLIHIAVIENQRIKEFVQSTWLFPGSITHIPQPPTLLLLHYHLITATSYPHQYLVTHGHCFIYFTDIFKKNKNNFLQCEFLIWLCFLYKKL